MQLQDPAALASLLAALERVERQEQEIHNRWFGGGGSSSRDAGVSGGQGVGSRAAAVADSADSPGHVGDQQQVRRRAALVKPVLCAAWMVRPIALPKRVHLQKIDASAARRQKVLSGRFEPGQGMWVGGAPRAAWV